MINSKSAQTCSFCGKSRSEVLKLIAGPSCCICDECVSLCNEIMAEGWTPPRREELLGWSACTYICPTWVMPKEHYEDSMQMHQWSD